MFGKNNPFANMLGEILKLLSKKVEKPEPKPKPNLDRAYINFVLKSGKEIIIKYFLDEDKAIKRIGEIVNQRGRWISSNNGFSIPIPSG